MQTPPPTEAALPNIVYILADDMGYGDVSCLNADSKIRTVHLDRMAADGMAFEDAHASSAVCTPSRYSILTGRYNWRSSMKQSVLSGYSRHLIEPGRMTVASMLKQHGYHTAMIGKWHLGWDWTTTDGEPAQGDGSNLDFAGPVANGPDCFGFDYYYGHCGSLDMAPYVYVENGKITAQPDRVTENTDKFTWWRKGPTGSDFQHEDVLPNFTRRSVDYIEKQGAAGEPFFLYFPLPAPHTPILPLPEFRGKSGTNLYGDFCLQVDDVVGQIMAALERAGVADNTILVFTTDNGCSPEADFEELAALGHHPSHVFRGHKADIYEGGHRIPLIVRWPQGIEAGGTSSETVCLCDLMATVADIVGDAVPDTAGEDSVSNLPVWQGQTLDGPLREATVHHSINGSFSIRQGRWKLEMCPGSGGWSHPRPGSDDIADLPPIQLYDLEADVGERTNVQDQHPDVVEKLTALLTSYVRDGRSTPGAPQPNTGVRYWPQLNWLQESDLNSVTNSH
ncbi:MAG: arylsulfatase [Kiritimatiellae bacterium]|nr:arylsulfatase [Kiritimatiellia bacterium]